MKISIDFDLYDLLIYQLILHDMLFRKKTKALLHIQLTGVVFTNDDTYSISHTIDKE